MFLRINEGCIGCGLCEGSLPAFFAIGTDGKAQVVKQPDAAEVSYVQYTADSCPAGVIELSDW